VPFDAVVELENVTYGDKVVAARMLIDSECASSMNDDAWANRCLGAASLLKTLLSTSRPQSAGLSPFLRICQNVLRGMGSSFKVEADTKTNSAEKALGLQLSNVCGQSALKATVREALIFPRQYSSVYRSFGIQPPSGILMYGPPGTGKASYCMVDTYE
jgi:ATP-dependent Zn protease